ncbi:MAG: hypothetical protein A4S09_06220 [Proteobacteria bacterium SG_bin7]|nr:MAG: hypothetical protein A4S09_06220 [Proteobacteria bacterium SG_bin7]
MPVVYIRKRFLKLKVFWRLLKDTGGQMAIFIALIFQVLFVFFAMIINIGLTVHDKINLQNSVDLAAYYAASKQAEILNAIAHVNYQIRQDYKLLAYRMRVIGGVGYLGHPSHDSYNVPAKEVPWDVPVDGNTFYTDQPAICIGHARWVGEDADENLCRFQLNKIPALPRLPAGPPFIPTYGINLQASQATEEARRAIGEKCRRTAAMNWYYAAIANMIFKLDVSRRRAAIAELAKAVSEADFKDLDGNSVKTGTMKTLEKNLTIANAKGRGKFILYNNLSSPNPINPETGMPAWLMPIFIEYSIPYVFSTVGPGNSCENNVSELMDTNNIPPGVTDATGNLTGLILNPPATSNGLFPIRGVEKNPWWMAFVAVYAESSPRKPFAPFGSAIKLKARAFAKPFGGRIGPWETKTWSPGSKTSDTLAAPIDPLAVPRIDRQRRTGNLAQDRILFPNYSKFPGDILGLKSTLALSHGRKALNNEVERLNIGDYDLPLTSLLNPNSPGGDAIAFDPRTVGGGALRRAEVAAVAPDLFDLTYYSIDANYFYYMQKELLSKNPRLLTADLGYQKTLPKPFTVSDQINTAIQPEFNSLIPGDPRFYVSQTPAHTLTGWTQTGEADYGFPSDKFGKCDSPIRADAPANPGNCIIGGRTGYSVKLVSYDYIMSSAHQLGGEGAAPGPIIHQIQEGELTGASE